MEAEAGGLDGGEQEAASSPQVLGRQEGPCPGALVVAFWPPGWENVFVSTHLA